MVAQKAAGVSIRITYAQRFTSTISRAEPKPFPLGPGRAGARLGRKEIAARGSVHQSRKAIGVHKPLAGTIARPSRVSGTVPAPAAREAERGPAQARPAVNPFPMQPRPVTTGGPPVQERPRRPQRLRELASKVTRPEKARAVEP